MGLYNFMPRFVPKIRSGEKLHTIRAKRAHPDKPGNTLHLYVGLRTRSVELIMRVFCVKVEDIVIDSAPENFLDDNTPMFRIAIDGIELAQSECESLARYDGFESFAEMMEFWDGRLPFHGDIIHWRCQSCLLPSQERAA